MLWWSILLNAKSEIKELFSVLNTDLYNKVLFPFVYEKPQISKTVVRVNQKQKNCEPEIKHDLIHPVNMFIDFPLLSF